MHAHSAAYIVNADGEITKYCYPKSFCPFSLSTYVVDIADRIITIRNRQCTASVSHDDEDIIDRFLEYVHQNNGSVDILYEKIVSEMNDTMTYSSAYGIEIKNCYSTMVIPSTTPSSSETVSTTTISISAPSSTSERLLDFMPAHQAGYSILENGTIMIHRPYFPYYKSPSTKIFTISEFNITVGRRQCTVSFVNLRLLMESIHQNNDDIEILYEKIVEEMLDSGTTINYYNRYGIEIEICFNTMYNSRRRNGVIIDHV
jgi:hypothetical protein